MRARAAGKTTEKQRPISELRAWLARHGLSAHEGARRLGMPYSVMKRVLDGKSPNLTTAGKFFYATDGELSFEQLLSPSVRTELKRRYRGALTVAAPGARKAPRRKSPAARRPASGSAAR